MMMVTVNDCITLISFKMRESSLGTPVGNDDAVLSSFSVLPELLEIDPVISYFILFVNIKPANKTHQH